MAEHKRIIWLGNSYYGSEFRVGCNYYSEILAEKGHQILFISPPVSFWHLIKFTAFRETIKRLKTSARGILHIGENYQTLIPFSFIPPVAIPVTGTFFLRNWIHFTHPKLLRLIRKSGFENPDIIVADHFALEPIAQKFLNARLIVRITDNLKGFGKSDAPQKQEERLLKAADKIIYTAKNLEGYVSKFQKPTQWICNGVDIDAFSQDCTKPALYEKIQNKIAVYVGAIDFWFDFDLLEYLVQCCPDIHFFIIGPIRQLRQAGQVNSLSKEKNITFTGPKTHREIVMYLKHAHVGIIPFNTQCPLVHSVSPIKLYEYMAAGLPVVSTRWRELEEIASPTLLADNADEFATCLSIAISEPNAERNREYARRNTWQAKAEIILE